MKTSKGVTIPDVLSETLRKNTKARRLFMTMPPSHQREYCKFVAEAKKQETQATRAAKTVEMILDRGTSRAKR